LAFAYRGGFTASTRVRSSSSGKRPARSHNASWGRSTPPCWSGPPRRIPSATLGDADLKATRVS